MTRAIQHSHTRAIRGGASGSFLRGACALVVLLTMHSSAFTQYTRTDHFDAALATLRRCASSAGTGDHHALIVSLRALNDPSLRPFFESLTRSTHWSSRIDGILGLAELSTPREIDPQLIQSLASVEDRSTAIRTGVGLRLLSPAAIQALLKGPDLPTLDRVVLNAELHRLGGTASDTGLRAAVADPSDEIAGLAAALLLERGDPSAWETFVTRISLRAPELRNAGMQELARAMLLYSIRAPIKSLIQLVQGDAYTMQTRMIANGSALILEPKLGQAQWKVFTAKERSQSALLRAGLQAMAQENHIEAGMGSSIRNGEPLIEAIADAIEANASADPKALATALEVVIDRANRQSAEWAVKRASGLPTALAAQVFEHLLTLFLSAPANTPALGPVVLDCASRLALINPSGLEGLINRSGDEPQLQETLILALCSAASPETAGVAGRVRGMLTRRGDALAVLAIARGSQSITPECLIALGSVAAGGGDIDQTLLVQAAWLFARHSGRTDKALAQMQPK